MEWTQVRNLSQTLNVDGCVKINEGTDDEMIAVPTMMILRKKDLSQHQKAAVGTLTTKWDTKNIFGSRTDAQLQRCPAIWVDNLIVVHYPGMEEPAIVFGAWKKEVQILGQRQELHGLVLAAGGHYERSGLERKFCTETGSFSALAAANQELLEEVKIPADKVVSTQILAVIDDVLNDPRTHGIRIVYARHVRIDPKASDELKKVVCVPLSKMEDLICGNIKWGNLDLILNHDKMLRIILQLPATRAFLQSCKGKLLY